MWDKIATEKASILEKLAVEKLPQDVIAKLCYHWATAPFAHLENG